MLPSEWRAKLRVDAAEMTKATVTEATSFTLATVDSQPDLKGNDDDDDVWATQSIGIKCGTRATLYLSQQ